MVDEMILIYMKMATGDDILGLVTKSSWQSFGPSIRMREPIKIVRNPLVGLSGHRWISLGKDEYIDIPKGNLYIHVCEASEVGRMIYNRYFKMEEETRREIEKEIEDLTITDVPSEAVH